jgi:hypothetical protein
LNKQEKKLNLNKLPEHKIMDMKKLIQKMTDIETGKKLLNESTVDECGTMPSTPHTQGNPVTVSVNFNASGTENVVELLNLLKNSGLQDAAGPSEPSQGMRMDMENFRSIVDAGDRDADDIDVKFDMDRKKGITGMSKAESESWNNSPNELYADHQTMTHDLSGGINRQKSMFKPAAKGDNPMAVSEAYINTPKDAIDTLGALRRIGKSIELGQSSYDGNLANMYVNEVWDVISWLQNNANTNDPEFKQVIGPVLALRKKAKSMGNNPGSGKDAQFGNEISNTLYPLMQWIQINVQTAKGNNPMSVKQEGVDKTALKARLLQALEEKKSKPDYLDVDGDGDRQEPMKKALADKKKVDEVSKSTLKSYAKRASSSDHPSSVSNLASRAAFALGKSPDTDASAGEKDDRKSAKRSAYIGKAIDKISKESISKPNLKDFKPKSVRGLYNFDHYEHPDGSFIQISPHGHGVYQDSTGQRHDFDNIKQLKQMFNPMDEAATGNYSAKKARAGKDIGKPGKQFDKIAKDAAKRYGSDESGKRVAGAVLAKLRKK